MESLRAELAEAKEEISKLSQDMHGQRRTVYRYNQLEELRNLQVCGSVVWLWQSSSRGWNPEAPSPSSGGNANTKTLHCYY